MKTREQIEREAEIRFAKLDRGADIFARIMVIPVAILFYSIVFYWCNRLLSGDSPSREICLSAGCFMTVGMFIWNWAEKKLKSWRSPN